MRARHAHARREEPLAAVEWLPASNDPAVNRCREGYRYEIGEDGSWRALAPGELTMGGLPGRRECPDEWIERHWVSITQRGIQAAFFGGILVALVVLIAERKQRRGTRGG
jgi:hypothetical protein